MKQSMVFIWGIALVMSSLSCEGPTGPQGPPGDGLGSLSDPSIMPKVIYSYPGANTTGPYPDLYRYDCGFEWCYYYSQFQVRFNKFMDLTSVRRAVRLSSPVGDIHADTNFILSIGGDVFILNPVDSNGYRSNLRFKIGATYSIGVDSTARDINGNALVPPYTATFVPEPNFRVMEVRPGDGASDVSTYTNPSVAFNARVPSAILAHVSIEPEIPGYWYMGYDSTWVGFQSTTILPTATEFTIIVDGTAEDVDGHRIPAPFTSRFTTTPFLVTAAFPSNGATGVNLYASVSINFSVPIDTSTFRSAFHFSPATAGTFYGLYPGTMNVTFAPQDGLLASTTYTIRIDSTLSDIVGDRLSGGYESSFTTAPFSIVSTTPPGGAVGVARFNNINVSTNALYDYTTVVGAVQLSPATPIAFIAYDGNTSFYFYAPSGLAASTTYTVTIGTGLRTKRGQGLPAPYTFSFTTGLN